MNRPIIGITSAYEMEEGLKNYHRTIVSIDYSKSVIAAGGVPFVIPVTGDSETIKRQLEMIDGLILSGGADVNPFLYGQDFKEGMGVISPERDECEVKIFNEFLKTEKPMLGICRGFQLMNICLEGTLFQDLKYSGTNTIKHSQDFYPDLPTHKIDIIDNDNILYDIFGEKAFVNSFHHQVIDKLGKELTVIAKSEDGVVEALQKKNHKFFYGVQWHPEMMTARGNKEMQKIFERFIGSCKK